MKNEEILRKGVSRLSTGMLRDIPSKYIGEKNPFYPALPGKNTYTGFACYSNAIAQ
jgi:hypothetical protein